jgi:hypothetical protein
MKYVKMLGLLAVAAAALMAFAGTASATVVTSPAGTAYTGTIKATSTNTALHGPFTTVACEHSVVEGKVEKQGADPITASGKISYLDFTNCNYPVKVLKYGSLEVHTDPSGVAGDGTLTSTGAEVTIETSIANCLFTTESTDIGTVDGSNTGHAVFNISASIPRTGHSFFCGSSGTWTGNYTVISPSTLYID